MRILVTGGAGYIGSQMVRCLQEQGHEAVVYDSLCSGLREAVDQAELIVGDIRDHDALDRVFSVRRFDGVMHFAALVQVGDSVLHPSDFHRTNVVGSLTLLDAMLRRGVDRLIFSSTAAVYGTPVAAQVDESHAKEPINPYGASKWMVEQILDHYRRAYGLKSVALRYFNAAGADPAGRAGPRQTHKTHLIPLVLDAAAGRRREFTMFGDDYDTQDGSGVRDYVHVQDLCAAHLLAFNALSREGTRAAYNLGNGRGYSVLEVVRAAERVTGCSVPIRVAARREGDPASLVADATAARRELGWVPQHADIDQIVAHAWRWDRALNGGAQRLAA